ncbi:TetR family transcriptional regulator [Herbihabitans rhizosphaerae]|uniref:TetR family transcriptional regulator n=1 Tax=Herbihabitans rhizosphaerae TaxID=1872711 RepID=A0A4Q7KQ70_9PSEU|nr:TetR family transcriptional regulator [Herbihabitans rhizosphaerae]RZS38949.1 TetR family transcriptional regulator [Herbihabitans rhizosphaerae]
MSIEEKTTDGRRIKGERRKRELTEATLRVVARDGVAGVSHRTVAREAGLPPTMAAYYFDGIDDLLTAALTSCLDEDAEKIRAVQDIQELAELMADLVAGEPGRLLAEFELYLLAARKVELRAATDRWKAALAEFARRHTDDPVRVHNFVGAYDGLLLQALLTSTPPTAADFEANVVQLLTP